MTDGIPSCTFKSQIHLSIRLIIHSLLWVSDDSRHRRSEEMFLYSCQAPWRSTEAPCWISRVTQATESKKYTTNIGACYIMSVKWMERNPVSLWSGLFQGWEEAHRGKIVDYRADDLSSQIWLTYISRCRRSQTMNTKTTCHEKCLVKWHKNKELQKKYWVTHIPRFLPPAASCIADDGGCLIEWILSRDWIIRDWDATEEDVRGKRPLTEEEGLFDAQEKRKRR